MEEILDKQAESGGGGPYSGREILSWLVDEYDRHERGLAWYLITAAVGAGLLVYAMIAQNFLFAVIIIMFGVIIGLSSLREPRKLLFVITELGVGVGGKFFQFKEFNNFWMLYEPPHVKNIYLEFKKSIRPHLVVPLDQQDPVEVREVLLRFIDEDLTQEDEPLADILGRFLKL